MKGVSGPRDGIELPCRGLVDVCMMILGFDDPE
jgi:hypothetical protein